MIFEFSSANPDTNWKEVETIFWEAIALGVGGKTSIGYGLGGHNDQRPAIVPSGKAKTNVMLIGQGVSSTLRSGEAEFRPNLFKASLRGHLQRLLAGVIGDRKKLDPHIDHLFGSSSSLGSREKKLLTLNLVQRPHLRLMEFSISTHHERKMRKMLN
jgi:CRISPR-associated protein Cmr6